jgi:hypothetical protein
MSFRNSNFRSVCTMMVIFFLEHAGELRINILRKG